MRISDTGGVFSGKVEKILDPTKQDGKCEKCTDARKDKPVLGMTIVEGVKKNPDEAYFDEKVEDLHLAMERVVSKAEIDKGAFKTPTCRNVAQAKGPRIAPRAPHSGCKPDSGVAGQLAVAGEGAAEGLDGGDRRGAGRRRPCEL